MTRIDDLHYMLQFVNAKGKIIYPHEENYDLIIGEWANLIRRQHRKGLIPLFITGSGVSAEAGVPTILKIVDKLYELYQSKNKEGLRDLSIDIEYLFKMLHSPAGQRKKDRSIIARLLNSFQENSVLKDEWQELNRWLLCQILNAAPTSFHQGLADLYKDLNAICLTLNFDGLLIREFVQYRSKAGHTESAFSLPTMEECERFFLRGSNPVENKSLQEFLEVQIRGDILYIKCDAKGFCPQKGKDRSIWASIASYSNEAGKEKATISEEDLLKCPSCGDQGISFLSFPGSYEKEKDMQNMLSIIWKYLAFRVGSVTVVGMSGEWDPLIVAFLGDLLSEREIPLLVVDKEPEPVKSGGGEKQDYTYVIRELITPRMHEAIALGIDANSFMETLKTKLINKLLPPCSEPITFDQHETDDSYWFRLMRPIDTSTIRDADEKAKIERLRSSINRESSRFEDNLIINKLKLSERLNRFAQLGLKSYWLGIKPGEAKYHNRYNHSIGVMKIASYIYDRATENSGFRENICEKQFLRLAALLHDVGHLPFSHLIEEVFNELNWKPAGYKESYSHLLQTNEKILQVFEDINLRKELESIGYTVKDLINLINGCFGVGYLDAIINSPVDADKIDYVFRDTDSTDRRISLSPIQFLKDIINGLSITPERYLSFSKVSAIAARQLLETRQHLYQNLYLQPGILILEGMVKLIIKTYFVHFLELKDERTFEEITGEKDYPDLGDYKIKYSIRALNDLFTNVVSEDDNNIELAIVKSMYSKIERYENLWNESFSKGLKRGFETLNDINNEDNLKALEANIVYRRLKGQRDIITDVIRDIRLRMPGAAIMELRRFPKYLSASDKRKEIERSDGTKVFAECILVPDGSLDTWTSTTKAAKAILNSSLKLPPLEEYVVYIYPLLGKSDDSYFKQTLNLFDKMLNKKGVYSFSHA